jgi:hypothetical protein
VAAVVLVVLSITLPTGQAMLNMAVAAAEFH